MEIFLPDEVILQILSYLKPDELSQTLLWSCCLVSRQWYACAVPYLYERPILYGKNFDPFAATICPSINLHIRKSPLAGYIRRLDMGRLVHQGSKSLTARILGRVRNNLEEFVAPQASFAINCFASLSKCTSLWLLDLALIRESIPLKSLLKCLSHLHNLTVFYFPRLLDFSDPEIYTWPPKLRELHITSGGIPQSFLPCMSSLPYTLNTLTIQRCSQVYGASLRQLLGTTLGTLTNLRIAEMLHLSQHSLDFILAQCPHLEQLSVPINNIGQEFLDPLHKNLCYLEITISNGDAGEYEVVPVDIYLAYIDGKLPKLRGVCYPGSLLIHSEEAKNDYDALDGVMQETVWGQVKRVNVKSSCMLMMVDKDLVGAWHWYPS
ncbi:MAG: hypothetical protein M1820_007816 [Bogoriella megaspora]|nr:MAG: hypothetical protein M1820_007816 [Bogoriella megaspora]